MKLICKCGTVYKLCEMPIDVSELTKKMNTVRCPKCNKSAKLACVYVGKPDE
jgi:hypothetical protein